MERSSDEMRKKEPFHNQFNDGRTRLPSRLDRCFRQVSVDLKLNAATIYVRQYFDEDTLATAAEFAQMLKKVRGIHRNHEIKEEARAWLIISSR